jgi:hypothetical protein
LKDKATQSAGIGEVLPPESEDNIGKFFGDPFAERTAKEDPVFRYISIHWRRIVTIVLAGVAAFYAYNIFHETRIASMQASGDAFMRVQREFDQFKDLQEQVAAAKSDNKSKDDKAKEELDKLEKSIPDSRRRLEESLRALGNMRQPYPELAKVYSGLLSARAGGVTEQGAIDPLAWQRITDTKSQDRLLAEVSAFGWARSQMDNESKLPDTRRLLKDLAQQGAYVHVAAGLSLSALALTDSERKEALDVLQSILAAHPEQDALLKDEIARLK